MDKLSERGWELVKEASIDRMDSEKPETSWCAQFHEFVPLLLNKVAQLEAENEKLREALEKLKPMTYENQGDPFRKIIDDALKAGGE